MSGTGFVTFRTLTARACAVQARLTNVPGAFLLRAAPESRDIRWKCITGHVEGIKYRKRVVTAALVIGVVFWGSFVAAINALSQPGALNTVLPFYEQLVESHPTVANIVSDYLPVVLLLFV
ncbi:unnamed protein product [Phaeothamnion confervicola]